MKEIQKLWRYKMGHVPSINFKIREGNEWIETNSHEMFKDCLLYTSPSPRDS